VAVRKRIPLFDLKLPPESLRQVRDVLSSAAHTPENGGVRETHSLNGRSEYAVALNSQPPDFSWPRALGCGPGREVLLPRSRLLRPPRR